MSQDLQHGLELFLKARNVSMLADVLIEDSAVKVEGHVFADGLAVP